MKKIKLCILLACFLMPFSIKSQSPFKNGNIVVVRLGDGTNNYGGLTAPMFLDEYTPSGALVQSIALPVADNGSNFRITHSYSAGDHSLLTLSPNKQFLTLAGFAIDPGTNTNDLSNATNRTIARIDYNGANNTSTIILGSDIGSGAFPRAVITDDGTRFWVASLTGIRYSLLGQSASVNILNLSNTSAINIENNQLFCTRRSVPYTISGGLPTSGPQTGTPFPNISNGVGTSSQAFFADLNPSIPGFDVVYLAESGNYALSKFSFDQPTSKWVLNGTIGVGSDLYRGITGVVNGTSVTLYCTKDIQDNNSTNGGKLVTFTDNSGYNGTFAGTPTDLVTASANTSFRGVAMAPQPLSVSLSTKVFLQGAYNTTLGRHKNVTLAWTNALNTNALNQPYNVAPFNYAGTESVPNNFFTFDDGVDTDILDWVLVELHDATTPSTIIARKACFIREDGKIVDLDKVSNPTFTGVGANNYYIVIRHRNHLAIRSSSTVFVNGATPITYDFTTAQAQAFQNPGVPTPNGAMKDFSGTFCMWGGNVNAVTTQVKYTGPNNDALALLAALGADQAKILSNVYSGADVNMDGTVRYTGPNNDALSLLAVLSANQATIINEHQ